MAISNKSRNYIWQVDNHTYQRIKSGRQNYVLHIDTPEVQCLEVRDTIIFVSDDPNCVPIVTMIDFWKRYNKPSFVDDDLNQINLDTKDGITTMTDLFDLHAHKKNGFYHNRLFRFSRILNFSINIFIDDNTYNDGRKGNFNGQNLFSRMAYMCYNEISKRHPSKLTFETYWNKIIPKVINGERDLWIQFATGSDAFIVNDSIN